MKIVISIAIILCLATQVKSQKNIYYSEENTLVFKLEQGRYVYDALQDYVLPNEWATLFNKALSLGIKNQTLKVDVEKLIGSKFTNLSDRTPGYRVEIYFIGSNSGKWKLKTMVVNDQGNVYGSSELSKQDILTVIPLLESRSKELKLIYDKKEQFK